MDDGPNPLRIFFNIFGRLGRGAYVKRWYILVAIAMVPSVLIATANDMPLLEFYKFGKMDGITYCAVFSLLVLYAASKSLQIRRLHDLGLSGIWLLVTIGIDFGAIFVQSNLHYFFLVAAVIYNFIFIHFYGTFGPNKYGLDPILRNLGDSDPITSSWFLTWQLPDLIYAIFVITAILSS